MRVRLPRAGLWRLTRYLRGKRLTVSLLMLAAMGEAAAQTGGWLLVRVGINQGIVPKNSGVLAAVVAVYVVVTITGLVLMRLLIRGLAGVGQGVVLGLRRDLFDHLTSLSLRYFSEQRAGWIIARLTSDVDALSDVMSQGLPTLVTSLVLLPAALIALFVNDWQLALVALVVLPPTIVATRWFQIKSSAAQLEVRNRIAAVTAQLAESVSGMAVVQAFNRERAFQVEFDELNGANRSANVYAEKVFSFFFPSIELLGVISTVSVLLVGSWILPSTQIGTLVAAAFLLSLVFQPLQELSLFYGQLQSASAAMVKISSVLDTERDIDDLPGARPLGRIEGDLELDRVVFSYGSHEVLHGIDVRVPRGGCIALVGESGGGKSTMAKLIARFYDPGEGAVRVDGVDLRQVQLHSYRSQLGVVLQDPFLFAGTLADNIRFARPEASDEEVEEAAAAIGADRIAARFELGYRHQVREGGAGLSAGERQLISIARALLANPRILILDEATSNIDRPTEILIEHALDRLLRGRTSVIIAHRLSTVRRADEILVVERGRIAQRGHERELLAQDGPYRRLAHELEGVVAAAGPESPRAAVANEPSG